MAYSFLTEKNNKPFFALHNTGYPCYPSGAASIFINEGAVHAPILRSYAVRRPYPQPRTG